MQAVFGHLQTVAARSEETDMPIQRFTLWLDGVGDITDDLANRLFEAGCNDGSPGAEHSRGFVQFDRESPSLIEAVTSAIRDVRSAGIAVERIDIEAEDALQDPAAALELRQINAVYQALRPLEEVA
jgi:hypothetical protein